MEENLIEKAKKEKFKPLKILTFPNEMLRKNSSLVNPEKHLEDINRLSELMKKTIKFYKLKSLSAIQAGVSFNLSVVNHKDSLIEMINPKIIQSEGFEEILETCISFPHESGWVTRAKKIKVEFLDSKGEKQSIEADGEFAHLIQHELDHLQGKLFIDLMSKLKKEMIIKSIKKKKGIL